MAVYLVCFERPFSHARHYVGYTNGDIDDRTGRHASARGSRLLQHITAAGIGWKVVRVWEDGDRALEKRIKGNGNTPRMCPVCCGHHTYENAPISPMASDPAAPLSLHR